MEAAVPAEEALVLVEYGFEYRAKDGTLVSIKPNERYVLLKRTNHHWWHVKRSGDARPFYIPAQYVKELPPIATPAALDPPPLAHAGTDPAPLPPQQPPAYEYRFIGATEGKEPAGGGAVPRGDSVPRRDSVPKGDSVLRRDSVPRKDSVPKGDSVLRRDSVPRKDLVPTRDSPPALSSFRVPPGLSPHPAEPVRPSHSLDDLARVTPAPHGATTTGLCGDPPGHPRPLGKSRSETLYAPGQDRDVGRRWPGSGRVAQVRPQPAQRPAQIYLNLQELRDEAAAASGSAPQDAGGWAAAWETHRDTESGLLFYYNPRTGETTWDCPFGRAGQGASPAPSAPSSPAHSPEFPEWDLYVDEGSGQPFFYNPLTGETSWDPPGATDAGSTPDMHPGGAPDGAGEHRPPTPEADYPDLTPEELEACPEDCSPLGSYDHGATPSLSPRHPEELGSPQGWYRHSHPEGALLYPEHFTSDMVPAGGRQERASSSSSQDSGLWAWHSTVPPALGLKEEKLRGLEKAGVLNRARTADRGRRLRKSWSSSWTVLEGRILTFFKDSKHSAAAALRQPSSLTTPEHTVELSGATLAWASRDKSSKKHVLELRTREGSEFLIQHDSEQIIAAWQKAIADSISRLAIDLPGEEDAEAGAEFGSREKLWGSEEKRAVAGQAVGSASSEGDIGRVRNKLRRFLQRRPTLQSLRDRGYIRDQVFGCSLPVLCERERGTVPRFVLQCIQTVERRGLDIDGLYRVSGNLATIQKLRYKVEHDEQLDLDDGRWEDIHVVTGALKLFLRELPEPLVPFSHFDKFIAAIKLPEPARRGRCVRELVLSLPPAHRDTMQVLFRHLCRVVEHREHNRMSVQSVAIVFGPTLLRPAGEEAALALHMVFQNQVVEHILNHFSYIFPDG